MANLPETPQWEDGIYQIEVSDPVLGGPDGISNRQGKQLASRTLYLKQQVEKGGSDLEKHIAAADPHTQYAPKASPTFTGTPTAPTQAKTDNSTKLATTAHVKSVVADYAPLSSPALTGKPTAPTAAQTANDTQLANTAFVKAAIAALVASSPKALDTLNELAAALGNDPNFATTMTNALAGKQPLDNTLTALSGKSVAALLEYLGLGELAKTPRFLVSKGENANGWYEIYSDGFKRVGQSWSSPLAIPTPASGVRVNYPISFTSKLSGLFVTENGNTSNAFEIANPAAIGLTGFNMATMEVTLGSSPTTSYGSTFTGFYVAEGY
ncbi:phage tail protein [Enterobacter hormaechei]|uniref:phage tail protein n=2 Tax=Enterobacter TaxID=547 RepID=UPI001EF138C9|nr:phage tail protein [Enterobacter hormaechei]